MGAVPTPAVQVAATVVAAATVNSQGNLANYLAGRTETGGSRKPFAMLRQITTSQSIATATWTAVTFDDEDVDYDNGHVVTVGTNDRYTAQTTGWHMVAGGCGFVTNATGMRGVRYTLTPIATGTTSPINASGSTILAISSSGTDVAGKSIPVFLNIGDILRMECRQESGGALSTNLTAEHQPYLSVLFVSV